MHFRPSAILLLPLLLAQGLYVRKYTPRLPEASGPREGVSGNGIKDVRLLILGDSAAAGVGANHQEQSLSGQTLLHLSEHFSVHWKLEAQTGRTTDDTLSLLASMPQENIDVVVLSLGVNDVTSGVSAKQWLCFQKELSAQLKRKFNCRMIIHSAVPPMHLFSALPQPLRWYLGRGALKFNAILEKWLLNESNNHLVKFTLTQDPNLLAEDGFHPSAKLYGIWGRQVAEVIKTNIEEERNNEPGASI